MKTREELKVDKARDEWNKLTAKFGKEPNLFRKTLNNQYYFWGQLCKLLDLRHNQRVNLMASKVAKPFLESH